MNNVNFMEAIKVAPDKEKEKLLGIQKQLEKEGITIARVLELTKDLDESEKQRLKQLYVEQIANLNSSTNNYKRKIQKIRAKIKK